MTRPSHSSRSVGSPTGGRRIASPVLLPQGAPTRIGYARVSTSDQDARAQVDALERAGCGRVYVDHASGKLASRPEWDRAREYLRGGDTLAITRLDRAGRSLLHLAQLGEGLRAQGVALHVTEQGIDPSTPEGRAMFGMLAVMAEFQRELIVANTHDGLAAAAARGRKGGRPSVVTPDKVARAREHLASPRLDGSRPTMEETARLVGVSRRTLYRALEAAVD